MPPTIREHISREIRAARARAGMHQRELAEEMRKYGFKWHPQTVSMVESGKREPTAMEMLALAIMLDSSITDLYGIERIDMTEDEWRADSAANGEPVDPVD